MGNKFQEILKEYKVWIIIVSIFILLVAYKYISSGIDEQRSLQAKEPLNQCLDDIDKETTIKINNYENLVRSISTPEDQAQCLKSASEEYCRPPSFAERDAEEQAIRDKAQIDKEECYKRYK